MKIEVVKELRKKCEELIDKILKDDYDIRASFIFILGFLKIYFEAMERKYNKREKDMLGGMYT